MLLQNLLAETKQKYRFELLNDHGAVDPHNLTQVIASLLPRKFDRSCPSLTTPRFLQPLFLLLSRTTNRLRQQNSSIPSSLVRERWSGAGRKVLCHTCSPVSKFIACPNLETVRWDSEGRLVASGWWLVAGGWWLVASGWWLVADATVVRARGAVGMRSRASGVAGRCMSGSRRSPLYP